MSIHIHLERFEGPLGLLLYLIRKEEMDIFDINIQQITKQYFDYIKAMRRLDLEVAGEFVAMAATLIQIKSRMLLPQYNQDGEEIPAEDPRKELVSRLLEYQRYQEASKNLYERPLVGRDLWLRGTRFKFQDVVNDDVVVEDNPLFGLISAYRLALRAMKTGVHKVMAPLQSVAARILEIKDFLVVGQRVLFSQMIDSKTDRSGQVLVTFLSLLELAKMGFISIFQSENFADIHVDAKKNITGDIVSQVENYDSHLAIEAADQLLLKAQSQMELDEAENLEDLPLLAQAQAVPRELEPEAATDEEIAAEEQRLNILEPIGESV